MPRTTRPGLRSFPEEAAGNQMVLHLCAGNTNPVHDEETQDDTKSSADLEALG
jgi:hypothetical protein